MIDVRSGKHINSERTGNTCKRFGLKVLHEIRKKLLGGFRNNIKKLEKRLKIHGKLVGIKLFDDCLEND